MVRSNRPGIIRMVDMKLITCFFGFLAYLDNQFHLLREDTLPEVRGDVQVTRGEEVLGGGASIEAAHRKPCYTLCLLHGTGNEHFSPFFEELLEFRCGKFLKDGARRPKKLTSKLTLRFSNTKP